MHKEPPGAHGIKKTIEQCTAQELLELKEDIQEIYGEGSFDKYFGREIIRMSRPPSSSRWSLG